MSDTDDSKTDPRAADFRDTDTEAASAAVSEVTRILENSHDRRAATDRLLPVVYAELRRMADRQLSRERPGQTLQPTGLVHEAYLRMIDDRPLPWASRGHFFAAAAEAMRRILIERARRYARNKHGAGRRRVTLDPDTPDVSVSPEDFLTLDRALDRLTERDPAMAEVVKLRYFAGLTVAETARCLALSPRSVNRQWTAARAWLLREVSNAS